MLALAGIGLLRHSPPQRWPRRTSGRESFPAGKITSSASDYLLCLGGKKARDTDLEELMGCLANCLARSSGGMLEDW